MINFYSSFLNESDLKKNMKLDSLLTAQKLKDSDPQSKPVIEEFRKENPASSDVATVADHIDWVVQLAGIDHVGLGSDFDGVGGPDKLPEGLKDSSQYPNLIYELLKRGYTEEDIGKICSGNLLRVWKKVAEVAAAQNNP